MNKAELASHVADRASLPRADAARAVAAVFDAITDTLAAGEPVTLTGFGRFATRARPARQGRNPATGDTIAIAASTARRSSPARRCATPSTSRLTDDALRVRSAFQARQSNRSRAATAPAAKCASMRAGRNASASDPLALRRSPILVCDTAIGKQPSAITPLPRHAPPSRRPLT